MNKYLIEFNAIVGRKKKDIADNDPGASLHTPIQLRYFGVAEAESLEAVNDQIVLQRDPGFVTTVINITELTNDLSTSALAEMLNIKTLITDLG